MMNASYPRRLSTLALLGLLGLTACSDNGSPTDPPPDPVPVAVEISPEETTLDEIGQTVTLEATVLDDEGEVIPDAQVSWSSSDEEIATVDEEGTVEALGEGSVEITAGTGEVTGTAQITVQVEES